MFTELVFSIHDALEGYPELPLRGTFENDEVFVYA